jgi:hypothetical protein
MRLWYAFAFPVEIQNPAAQRLSASAALDQLGVNSVLHKIPEETGIHSGILSDCGKRNEDKQASAHLSPLCPVP